METEPAIRKFFNESKKDRIKHNIQKTGSQLFIRFRSNYILSFVDRAKAKVPAKNFDKKPGGNVFCQARRW